MAAKRLLDPDGAFVEGLAHDRAGQATTLGQPGDLTKRMLRLTPFIFLNLLDQRELCALVDELIDQSTAAFR